MKYLELLGRIFYASIFLKAAPGIFTTKAIGFTAGHGVPLAPALVPLAGALALGGGLSVALGCKARYGAWMLVGFLLPVTPLMHDYWNLADAAQRQLREAFFLRNVAFLGSALVIAYFGAGPVSVDGWLASSSRGSASA